MEKTLKEKLYCIIFEADTVKGKAFDIFLLVAISLSVLLVLLESVKQIEDQFGTLFFWLEWIVTIVFTTEYVLRVLIVPKPFKYIFSFYGIIDLLSVIPSFLEFFIVGAHGFMVIRVLRMLRIFRVMKLSRYVSESRTIVYALVASRYKIGVFLYAVLMVVIIMGTIMYIVEGPQNDFTSIPYSIYWAIVTLTTVGYGDLAPVTPLGQMISSLLMITGYAIIAVPTGIVTTELQAQRHKKITTITCHECLKEGHDHDAHFCKFCGAAMLSEE